MSGRTTRNRAAFGTGRTGRAFSADDVKAGTPSAWMISTYSSQFRSGWQESSITGGSKRLYWPAGLDSILLAELSIFSS